jgi:hypothetical protein
MPSLYRHSVTVQSQADQDGKTSASCLNESRSRNRDAKNSATQTGGKMKHFIISIISIIVALVMAFPARSAPIGFPPTVQAAGAPAGAGAQVRQDIRQLYGMVVADRAGRWTEAELISLKASLDAVAAKYTAIIQRDATPVLKRLLQGTVIYREGATDRIAYTLSGVVYVYDLWTTYDQTGRTFYLAHEIGHLLDTRTSLFHWFMGEVSTDFARNVGAYTDARGVYHLGDQFPRPATGVIRHRSDSATEDWPESFATVLVPEFEANLRDIGAARQAEVKRYLSEWSAALKSSTLITREASLVKTLLQPDAIDQPRVAVPAASVRILHRWTITQDGVRREYREENLGTIIAPDLILTRHSYYALPQPNWSDETYTLEIERGRPVQWEARRLRLSMLDDNTMLIRLPVGAFSAKAKVADRTTVNRLAAGTWLTITYWDDVTRQFRQHDFQIVQIENGLATLADPDKHINRGDSGGGAYWQGQLVGNIRSIQADPNGKALGLFNVALVPALRSS